MVLNRSPWKSTWSPNAALSAPDPVRIPRLPMPDGGPAGVAPNFELGPDLGEESQFPMTLRSTMLQSGPEYVVFNWFFAAWLRSLEPTAPSLSRAVLIELFLSRSPPIAPFLRSLETIVPSLMSALVISFAATAPLLA